ncbi:hypothetical protein, partial [Longimycelium tulufanense]|uniref:hypothetical protein n=1 Tax=Longimycelium tulufanense TaxID=907463 RepID=UPI001E3A2EA9
GCAQAARVMAAGLSYGELAVAVAWSGVELPREVTTFEDAVRLAAVGILRRGVGAIREADQRARALRCAGRVSAASALYGGLRREDLAHAIAFATVAKPVTVPELRPDRGVEAVAVIA